MFLIPFLILVFALELLNAVSSFPELTSYREILPFLRNFSSDMTGNYSAVISDPETNSLIVGGRDRLLRLNADTMTELESVELPSKLLIQNKCLIIQDDREECYNFIKIIHRVGDRIFVCGTNSNDPVCWWRQLNNIHQSTEEMDGKGRAPYASNINSSSTFTSDGNYYVGTWLDTNGQDSVFYRSLGDSPFLRTLQLNEEWLKRADFVATFEIGDFVYFFFREISRENTQLGDVEYSRIARVCKCDRGGNYMYDNVWITYRKARIACVTKRQGPTVRTYDSVQSVYYDKRSQLFLAAFNDITSSDSAICAYDLASVESVFDGPFNFYVTNHDIWVSKPNPYALTNLCQARQAASNSSLLYENMIMVATTYQLMYEPLLPLLNGPIYVGKDESLSHMIAHQIYTEERNNTTYVIYLTTVDGILNKLYYVVGSEKGCLVEKIYIGRGGVAGFPTPFDRHQKIRKLSFSHDETAIYILRDDAVIKMDVLRCERFKTKQSCQNSMDAYCGWDSIYNQCSPRPTVHSNLQYWRQNSVSCRAIQTAPGEAYGDWTDWDSCNHVGPWRLGEKCICRLRACLNSVCPTGATLEITNCTAHGGWTKWSQWSACSHTCGFALRYRERSCTNPSPKFGGRPCSGKARDEEFCGDNPPCPEIKPEPIHGGWSRWNEWSTCSRQCGVGMQNRSRDCVNPQPQYEGNQCVGCDSEYKLCNTHTCSGSTKESNWTNWYILNFTMDNNDIYGTDPSLNFQGSMSNPPSVKHYSETRFRFSCKTVARNNRPDQLVMKPVVSQTRVCSNRDQGTCVQSDEIKSQNTWSSWSEWSICSSTCGKGIQNRTRSCLSPTNLNDGKNKITCKGSSFQTRSCYGNVTCTQGMDFSISWESWSSWTMCDVNNEESRFRICKTRNPAPNECLGLNVEKRSCTLSKNQRIDSLVRDIKTRDDQESLQLPDPFLNTENLESNTREPIIDNSLLSQYMLWRHHKDNNNMNTDQYYVNDGKHNNGISIYQLITGCVVAFLCGILVTGALFATWYRKKFRDCLLNQQKSFLFHHSHGRTSNPFMNLDRSGLLRQHSSRQNSLLKPLKDVSSSMAPNTYPLPIMLTDDRDSNTTLMMMQHQRTQMAGTNLKSSNSFKTVRNVTCNGNTLSKYSQNYDHANHYYQIHGTQKSFADDDCTNVNTMNKNKSCLDQFTLIPSQFHINNNNCNGTNDTLSKIKASHDMSNNLYVDEANAYYEACKANNAAALLKFNAATLLKGSNKTSQPIANIYGTNFGVSQQNNNKDCGGNTIYAKKASGGNGHANTNRYNAYSSLPRLKKEASFKESTIKRNELFPPHVYDDPF